jgi:hypothetical protein
VAACQCPRWMGVAYQATRLPGITIDVRHIAVSACMPRKTVRRLCVFASVRWELDGCILVGRCANRDESHELNGPAECMCKGSSVEDERQVLMECPASYEPCRRAIDFLGRQEVTTRYSEALPGMMHGSRVNGLLGPNHVRHTEGENARGSGCGSAHSFNDVGSGQARRVKIRKARKKLLWG